MLRLISFRFVVILLLRWALVASAHTDDESFSRYDFPPGFVFGSATSAYQVNL